MSGLFEEEKVIPLHRLPKDDPFRWIWGIKFGDEWVEGPCREYHTIPNKVMVIEITRSGVVGRFGANPRKFKKIREREL